MFRQLTNQNHYPGFRVIVMSLDSTDGWLIQTLLRGENDSKQSDEIQAKIHKFFTNIFTSSTSNFHIKVFKMFMLTTV